MSGADAVQTERNPFSEGLGRRKNPDPCVIVLFGASGDLTQRKLLPALYNLARDGLLPAKFAIIGFARRPKDDDQFRREMLEGVRQYAREYGEGEGLWDEFSRAIFYHSASFDDQEGYQTLARKLEEVARELGLPCNRLFYLATSPGYFSKIVHSLDAAGLARPADGCWSRVVIEKPFGRDLESAKALNRELHQVLAEEQIYRIDHYLGKETVQNLLALRFANGIFEPLWNQKYVDSVQITVAESIGVEGRGGYYDKAGVLRDMVQNHMLQVLSLVAMEPPVDMSADAIRDEKVKVLRSVRRIPAGDVDRHVVRGQYDRGTILGRSVPGYKEDEGVPADSRAATYVALRLDIQSWRWSGVPFFLRSGKRLPKRVTEVCIEFKKPPLLLFSETTACTVAPNALIINVQPDEGISLRFGAKVPGPDIEVRQVKMDFRYGSSFGVPSPEAYERLLLDAMSGDSTLFTRRDEVEAAWTLMTDVLEGWQRSEVPPARYAAGSWGPAEAERLFDGCGGSWRRL